MQPLCPVMQLADVQLCLFSTGHPSSERFAFCLATALSDVAARRPDKRDAILGAQVRVFASLVAALKTHRESAEARSMAGKGQRWWRDCSVLPLRTSLSDFMFCCLCW